MSKSEELAKLLGIEPKMKKVCNKCGGVEYWRSGACLNHKCNWEINDTTEKPFYPDFTKPSNFVKLLNILYDYDCVQNAQTEIHRVTLPMYSAEENIQNGYIKYLVTHFDKFNRVDLSEILKQQAQQTEWEY